MGRSGRFLFLASLLGLLVSSALLVVVLGYLALVVYLALRTGTPIVEIANANRRSNADSVVSRRTNPERSPPWDDGSRPDDAANHRSGPTAIA